MRIKSEYEVEEYFTELSSFILEFTTNYSSQIIHKILDNDQYVTEPKRFFYTLIHKTNCSLSAANILVRNFDSNRNLHTPLFILIRSILSDIILAEYVIVRTKNDEILQKEIIERIYFDHIDNVLKTCEKTLAHMHKWSPEEKQKRIESIKKGSRFFDDNGHSKIKAIPTNPSQLMRKLFANKLNSKSSQLLKIAYDQYAIFSKFEHFGELSFDLTHKGYDDTKIEDLRYELHFSIRIIIGAMKNYSSLWKTDFRIDTEYFDQLHTEITELLPGKIKCA